MSGPCRWPHYACGNYSGVLPCTQYNLTKQTHEKLPYFIFSSSKYIGGIFSARLDHYGEITFTKYINIVCLAVSVEMANMFAGLITPLLCVIDLHYQIIGFNYTHNR